MGWFSRKKDLKTEVEDLRNQLAAIKAEMSPAEEKFLKDFMVGGWTGGGLSINRSSAMKCATVFACVRLISGCVSSVPVRIAKGNKWDIVDKHPYQKMLGNWPNNIITSATFWKSFLENKLLGGNAYAPINRGPSGRPIGLVPVRHDRVEAYQAWELSLDTKLGVDKYRLFYSVSWDDGTVTIIDQDDMIHVPNIGWDGKKGLSTISAGAQAMGLALSQESSASELFSNGMQVDIALTYPNKMNPDIQDALRKHIEDRHVGRGNHHKPLILTEGGDVKTLTMNASDAQLVESREYSAVDICKFFGVPPAMIGEMSKTTSWGSGVEQMAIWFSKFTLNDHFTDIEQELKKKLFRDSDHFAYFDETELTRGDTKTQAEYYKAALGNTQQPGWLSQNEVRKAIGEAPDKNKESDELCRPDPNAGPIKPNNGDDKNVEE